MKYNILGDSDCPMIHITMQENETIRVERGAMVYMQNIELQGKMNTNKSGISGFLSALGRSMTSGESFFVTEAKAQQDNAYLGIAPATAGKIRVLQLDNEHQYCVNTGCFLACDGSVQYNMKRQDLGKALFAGTGGLFIMETTGTGNLLISSYGDLIEINVTQGAPVTIDNQHVVAWENTLDYDLDIASGTFGFTSGEGIVNHFKGNGKVWIQTRNIRSLADALIPYLPTQTSSNN